MKVNIGPYRDYNKKTKRKLERVIKVQIDPYDTWSMDSTLAYIVVPMLKQLKKTKHGSPFIDMEDVPARLRSEHATDPVTFKTDKHFHARWNWVLGEMIWAFEQINDDNAENKFYTGKADYLSQALDKQGNKIGEPGRYRDKKYQKFMKEQKDNIAFYEQVQGPKHTLVHHEKEHQKYENRKKNGFRLFGKYLGCLWD